MKYLDIETPSMNIQEVEDWSKEIWIIERQIFGIPVEKGLSCNLCNYSSGNRNVMKNHFSKSHRGFKWSDSTKECKVQKPFKGQFNKWIQVTNTEELNMESDQEEDWQSILKEDFKRKV